MEIRFCTSERYLSSEKITLSSISEYKIMQLQVAFEVWSDIPILILLHILKLIFRPGFEKFKKMMK